MRIRIRKAPLPKPSARTLRRAGPAWVLGIRMATCSETGPHPRKPYKKRARTSVPRTRRLHPMGVVFRKWCARVSRLLVSLMRRARLRLLLPRFSPSIEPFFFTSGPFALFPYARVACVARLPFPSCASADYFDIGYGQKSLSTRHFPPCASVDYFDPRPSFQTYKVILWIFNAVRSFLPRRRSEARGMYWISSGV